MRCRSKTGLSPSSMPEIVPFGGPQVAAAPSRCGASPLVVGTKPHAFYSLLSATDEQHVVNASAWKCSA